MDCHKGPGIPQGGKEGPTPGRAEDSEKSSTKGMGATAMYNNASQGKRQTVHGQRDSSATCGCVTLFKVHYFSEPQKTHRAALRSKWAKDGARDL